jgi:hypothetical protein
MLLRLLQNGEYLGMPTPGPCRASETPDSIIDICRRRLAEYRRIGSVALAARMPPALDACRRER